MYFEALKIFCDVIKHRSFSRAAAANQISQSAASQNVLQLERSLGVRLLDRSKRPFQLTREGETYYDGCKGLVEKYYAVEEQVKAIRNEVSGSVTVAAIYSIALSGMSRYVEQFARKYPHASVRLSYLHPDRVYQTVLAGETDLGLISYPKTSRELIALPWNTERMVLACYPGHALAGRAEVAGRDFAGERFIAFDEDLNIRKEIDRQLRKYHVEVDVVMAFDNTETIKRAVELKEGVAILPEPTFRNEVRTGSMVAVPLTAPTIVRPLGIIHRRAGQLSRTAQQFIGLIQEAAEPLPPQPAVESSEMESKPANLVGATE
jgi:DNA-binding transcriptional LysR family regulator